METHNLTGYNLKAMLDSALLCLQDKYKTIDSLNVFPVPDGDTGTNMYLTMTAAVEEAAKAGSRSSITEVAEAASRGALMGARGNSGVILSQLLRGLALGLRGRETVTGEVFAEALNEGVRVAFRAVMKPVEGTILTVAREAAAEAVRAAGYNASVAGLLAKACSVAEDTLNQTPELLPALKEAGVVDAGGMGWLVILKGFYLSVGGEQPLPSQKPVFTAAPDSKDAVPLEGDLKYPYCTEVLIRNQIEGGQELRDLLEGLGDSLIVVENDGLTKVHVHSSHPGEVLEVCLKFGSLTQVQVSNMSEQSEAALEGKQEKQADGLKKFGIVSIAFGAGIKSIMESLGADIVVYGGQTMNPSTQELKDAVDRVNADTVFILPNNKNIIMTAGQVENLTDKNIQVIPTKTMPQGISALLTVSPEAGIEKISGLMLETLKHVKTGEVTYAVRDTSVNGTEINEGSIIGLTDDKIIISGKDLPETLSGLLENLVTSDDEVCALYYGEQVTRQEAEEVLDMLEEKFPHIEFEVHQGGQPLYYYIISVE
ncbi:DAK2 domain-containing protein [Phosphitispora fastidiosa]|uniref:DAK2 domain-containing protein n=1 Tax=Phosphitispora fastidiosa TaxID=2837202 RepID=UPI001E29A882|nr:DAK2 domain fusion protein YloV [Phosphitispora fastidiosa]